MRYPVWATMTALFSKTEGEGIGRLANLCKLLQEISGREPFHLDIRTAGKLFGVHYNTTNKWLIRLANDGVLIQTAKHDWKAKQARRFYYRGNV